MRFVRIAYNGPVGPFWQGDMRMRIPHESTVSELKKRRGWYGSLEAVRNVHGIEPSKGTLSRIVRGQGISVGAENAVRRAFGMEPWGIEVPPCPDCGSVHTGRCHGLPVAAVVVLAPGDVVTHNGNGAEPTHKRTYIRKRRVTVALPVDVAAQLDAARLPGESRVDAIRRLTDGLRTKVV